VKQLQAQKQQHNITNFKVRMFQQEVVLIQGAKKGHKRKFISVNGPMYKDISLITDKFSQIKQQ
jgi:hypothetical protein